MSFGYECYVDEHRRTIPIKVIETPKEEASDEQEEKVVIEPDKQA